MGGLTASPVLVGAVTLLVGIVAVFLSYNANSGLPFVPTYDVKAELPSAANLVAGNEVRIGGARVGVVSDIEPVPSKDGNGTARLTLKLDKNLEPLPIDSTFLVRPKSALGLKYVELTPGRASAGYDAGRDRPAAAGDPAAGRARRCAQHVRPRGPARIAADAQRLRHGLRRAAARASTRRSRTSTRCSPTSSRSLRTSPRGAPASTACSRRSAPRPARSRRSRESTPRCSPT